MLKIIQICAAYKPAFVYGGPTMSVAKLAEELTKAGQDVTVLATTANGKTELEVPIGKETLVDGVKVYYFKRLTKDHTHFSPSLFWFLHQTLKSEKRKTKNEKIIVHIHAWWNLVSIFSRLVAKLHGVKVVLSPRGMLNKYTLSNNNSITKRLIHVFLGKPLLKKISFHATSPAEKEDISAFINQEAHVLPNFIELPTSAIRKTSADDTYRLLFLGRINEIKGLQNLLSALPILKRIKWSLTIAGEGEFGYVESLKLLTKENNIDQQVKWVGHLSDNHKFDLLSNSDILILPSYKENFANVVIESLAMGTPVLVNSKVGLSDYVTQTNLGWVTSTNSPQHLADAIQQSFLDQEKRIHIRENAPIIIRKDFDDTNLVNQYIAMYNKQSES